MLRRAGKVAGAIALCALGGAVPAAALTPIADLGTLGSLGVRLDGSDPGENAALALASGDVNGDGRGDLLVGAPGQPGEAGEAYLVLGTTSLANVPDLDNPPAGVTVLRYGGVAGDRLGTIVHLGDVTGDSKADIILGAPGADPGGRVDAGSVYVLPGTAAPADDADVGTLPAGGSRFDGDAPFDHAGHDVFTGDVTADAKEDLLIGAPFADTLSGVDAGTVHVVPGAAALAGIPDLGTPPAGAVRFDGEDAGDLFGFEVTSSDVRGSFTKEDLVIGGPLAKADDTGRTYIVPGNAALAGDDDMSTFPPGSISMFFLEPGGQSGRAVATGDYTGDSRDEVVFGAPFVDGAPGPGSGAVAVFDATVDTFRASFGGDDAGDAFGWDIALGDVTGNSKEELVVGAPSADPGGKAFAGRAYLIPGATGSIGDIGFPPPGVLTYDGLEPDDALGSTTDVGDLNADLREDIVLGAERADPSARLDAGSAFVLFGDNAAPIVSLDGAPDPVEIGDAVTWTATGTDPEGGPLEYSFDVDGVPGFEVPFGASNTRNQVYFSPGVKTGTVRARDVGGATADASDTVTVTAGEGATNCAGGGVSFQFGTNGPDTLSGGYGRQAIAGLGGADTIEGGYNDDCLFGNAGKDTVDGGYDNDFVSGGAGNDILKGGYGNDLLNAEDGSGGDTVNCGAGTDHARVDPGDSVTGCETTS